MISLIGEMLIILSFLIVFNRRQTDNKSIRFLIKTPRSYGSLYILYIVSMFSIFVIIVLIATLRTLGYWDDTMYHLPISRFYVENQGIVLNEYLRFPLVPQDMQMLFALGLMIGGDAAAQAMATIPIFIISLGLIGC